MSEDVQNNSTSPADTTDQSVNDVSAQTSNQPASDSIQQEATPAANLAESTEATAAEEQQPSAPQEAAKQDSSREQKQEPQTDEEESSKPAAGSSDTSENAIPENETESERAEREAKTQREILEEELKKLHRKIFFFSRLTWTKSRSRHVPSAKPAVKLKKPHAVSVVLPSFYPMRMRSPLAVVVAAVAVSKTLRLRAVPTAILKTPLLRYVLRVYPILTAPIM